MRTLSPVVVTAAPPREVGIGNSTFVALALFALFLVYITARGRLPQYLAVLFGKVTSDQGSSGAAGAVSGAAGLVGSVGNILGGAQGGTVLGGVADVGSFFGSPIPAGV